MPASQRKHTQQIGEPEILKRHKRLYEERLEELHLLRWVSERDNVKKTNSPAVLTQAAETQAEEE
jgi:hypothetical protein